MKYYAKTYTGDPKIGLLTPGECLTETQAVALGEDRIADMVERGVLGVMGEAPAKAEAPAAPEAPAKKAAKPARKAEKPADPEEDGEEIEAEEDEDDLPELDGAEAIDEEETPAVKPAKTGKGRKTK